MKNLLRLSALIALSIGMSGCARLLEPKEWEVVSLQFSEGEQRAGAAVGMDGEVLHDEVVRALERTGVFRVRGVGARPPVPGDSSRRVECRLRITDTRERAVQELPGEASAEVAITLELKREGWFERIEAQGQGASSFDASDRTLRQTALQRALQEALVQAVGSAVLGFASLEKSEKALVADLSSEDPRVRDYAIQRLADQKGPLALQSLIGRLRDPERRLQLRALGALAELHSEEAIPAILEFAPTRDLTLMRSVIEVVGAIGGRDAKAYLFFLSTGHFDPIIRLSAQEAFDRLEERAQQGQGLVKGIGDPAQAH